MTTARPVMPLPHKHAVRRTAWGWRLSMSVAVSPSGVTVTCALRKSGGRP